MHANTKHLLDEINKKLENSPLIYFSRDIERGIGLENILDNYHLACIEDNYIVDQLYEQKDKVFCLNREGINLSLNSTLELINHEKTKDWIKKVTKGKEFYAQLFQFNQPAISAIENLGGRVLNNHVNLNRKFEDKVSQHKVLEFNNIPIPKAEITIIDDTPFIEHLNHTGIRINNREGEPMFIVQIPRAHTGSGTFYIRTLDDWNFLQDKYLGNVVKIAEYTAGDAYTVNACITRKGIFVAGLQYQITGIRELTAGEGSTVGNDFSYANKLDNSIRSKICEVTKKVGDIMKRDGFRGLYGLDIIVRRGEIYVIEINARQTANIPLQTKLELLQNKIPLQLINLAEWLGVEIPFEPFPEIEPLEGSQVFLRSKTDELIVAESVKSGIYRLQSDNVAKTKSDEDVIHIDEEGDKPLIWQKDGYSVEDIENGGFVLLIQKKGNVRDKYDEIARMQFKHQIMIEHNKKMVVSPWIIEAMEEIRERIAR